MGSSQTIEALSRVSVFAGLAEAELGQVADIAVPRSFAAGEIVFRQGDQSDTCYVVQVGLARALHEHADGRSITFSHFGPGELFGELAMFDEQPRSASVDALEPTDTVAILSADMRRLIDDYPAIGINLIRTLALRLRSTDERLVRQSFQSVRSRVAAMLLQLAQQACTAGACEADVVINSTQADLARLAGSSRESASRALAVLERAGVITQGRRRVTVHDPNALERYVY